MKRFTDKPFSLDAEQAVIGCLLKDSSCYDEVSEVVTGPEFFWTVLHQEIFKVVGGLRSAGNVADVTSVFEGSAAVSELARSRTKLIELIEGVATTSNVMYYAEIVRKYYIRRSVSDLSHELHQKAFISDPEDLLGEAESKLLQISQSYQPSSESTIGEGFHDLMDSMNDPSKSGVLSGFESLDDLVKFRDGDLVIIAARPRMGKSALAVNLIENLSIGRNVPTAMISLEMSKEQIQKRIIASLTGISMTNLMSGDLSERDWQLIAQQEEVFTKAPMYFSDNPRSTMQSIRSTSRRWVAKDKVELIVIDYLQLIQPPGGKNTRNDEVQILSREMKILARELQIPIVLLSQLNRRCEERIDKRPMLSDLRDSGAIEQDADDVLFIHRGIEYLLGALFDNNHRDHDLAKRLEETGESEVIVAKQRNGPTGTVRLYYHKTLCRFREEPKESSLMTMKGAPVYAG